MTKKIDVTAKLLDLESDIAEEIRSHPNTAVRSVLLNVQRALGHLRSVQAQQSKVRPPLSPKKQKWKDADDARDRAAAARRAAQVQEVQNAGAGAEAAG